MIYSVSVYDKSGNLKKVISAKSLSRKHWEGFKAEEKSQGIASTITNQHIAVKKSPELKTYLEFERFCDSFGFKY